jgi:hypothetical protein
MTDKTDEQTAASSAVKTPTNFAAYPESLSERKAHKAQDGALWTPRDALIDMLRRIDNGEVNPRVCLVAIDYEDEDGEGCTAFNCSSPTYLQTVGLAGRLFFSVNESAYRG